MNVFKGILKPTGVPFRDGFHVSFSMFVDRKGVMDRVERKRLRVLARTGGVTRVAMRRSIRPPTKKEAIERDSRRTVTVDGLRCRVPLFGKVRDASTGQPVIEPVANRARKMVAAQARNQGAGQPPKRGATDLLRSRIFFGVEAETETVVIGPEKFTNQPELIGAASVPHLLDKGGKEIIQIGRERFVGNYAPRPFVGPLVPFAERKLAEFIEETPL